MIDQGVFFLLSIIFGFVSISFGIGVAAMIIPSLLLLYQIPFSAAVAITLLVEITGFSAGLFSYVKKRLISYSLGMQMLLYTIPASVVGVLLSTKVSFEFLVLLFSCALIIIAIMIFHPEHEVLYRRDDPARGVIRREFGLARDTTMVSGTLAGLLAGMTSTGIGEINNYVFLKRYHMSGKNAAATSIFVITITAFVAASAHLVNIFFEHPEYFSSLGYLILYGVLGVIIGVWFASLFTITISSRTRERYVATIFFALGILSLFAIFV